VHPRTVHPNAIRDDPERLRPSEIYILRIGIYQKRTVQIGVGEVRVPELRALQPNPGEDRPGEIGA